MNTWELAVFLVAIVVLVLAVFGLVLFSVLQSRKEKQDNSKLHDDLIRLEEKINQSQQEIEHKTAEALQAQALENSERFEKTLRAQMDSDTQRLNNFQSTIMQNLSGYMTSLDTKLDQNLATIHNKVDQSLKDGFVSTSDSMSNLSKQLGVMQEAQKNIQSLQGEITALTNVLGNNQQRGKYGEWQLELLLQNMFGDTQGTLYDTQFILKDDATTSLKPDAVVFLDGKTQMKLVPIDSKFSLTGYEELFDPSKELTDDVSKSLKSQFRSAIKKRIDETGKYILPGKTIDSSIMFVPNDGVFAFLESEMPDLSEYARSKHVVITSPALLGPLLYSFRIIQIEDKKNKNLVLINQALNDLSKEFHRFMPRWQKLNDSIQRLTNTSGDFDTTVNKIDKKFTGIANMEIAQLPSDAETETEPEKTLPEED